jgi:diacylglycerol kinase family enzyme
MMVGIGYDAWVVEGVDPALKKRLGKLAYVLSMVRELKRFGRHQYQLHIDGSVHTAASVVATLGRHYAGSYVLAREARIDLPELHLVLVQTLSRWAFLLMLLALPLGLAQRLPFMKTVRGRHVRVTPWPDAGTTESLQADGDTVGSLPAVISVEEDPLQVLVPG